MSMRNLAEIGVVAGLALTIGTEVATAQGSQLQSTHEPSQGQFEPMSTIPKRYPIYLPHVTGGMGQGVPPQVEQRYAGWPKRTNDLCELWDIQDKPQGGHTIVRVTTRPYHEEHNILSQAVAANEYVIVYVRERECEVSPDTTTLDVSRADPLNNQSFLPTVAVNGPHLVFGRFEGNSQ